ncbi:MAG: nucleotide exchange factor GrpE [Eubacterium sp.]|nr:nucleotide exchange factor GrpE [Eubacterium sp.]
MAEEKELASAEEVENEAKQAEDAAPDTKAPEEEADMAKEDLKEQDEEKEETVGNEEKKESGKKNKKLSGRAKKDKKDEKIEELNDRLLRNMAEFENFRNRSEKEKTAMFEIGAKSVVEKILPVVDNFERGLDAVTEEEKDNGFVKGMEAIYKQFCTALEEMGVVPIEAVGKEFDPNLHNAVMHEEDDSMEANMVSEELQKGYMYKESVVRHSMVKVVN